ncbi:MAG: phosphate signaling complex protein PhoU [Nitrospirae bacterium]|nr:phosphate signaling complex protein PhoU [Nitrospirota bacterium]
MIRHLDAEIDHLKGHITEMGNMVDLQMKEATEALMERDPVKARGVIDRDHQVNAMEVGIDEDCVRMIALHQPEARDLRFVITAMKIITDLERMSDLASNISERVVELCMEPPISVPPSIMEMSTIGRGMLREALDAFVTRNTALARQVTQEDEQVNVLHRELVKSIVESLKRHTGETSPIIRILFVSRSLERFADHATNVAEIIMYMVEGKIIRHMV